MPSAATEAASAADAPETSAPSTAADRIGIDALDVSLTHERDFAIAAVVGVRSEPIEDAQASRERLVARLRERGLL